MVPQVPFAPAPFLAVEQALQTPPQAVLQHMPSTQKPLAHSWAEPGSCPLPVVMTHTPPLH